MNRFGVAFLLIICVGGPSPGRAQENSPGVLVLQIFDFNSGRPLSGVAVTMPELSLSTTSDLTGFAYLIDIPLGSHRVEISHDGYGTVQAILDFEEESTWADGEVVLVPELAGVAVTVPRIRSLRLLREGFYERQRRGFGHYFTRESRAMEQAFFLSDVLRRIPGIRVGPSGFTSGTGFNGIQNNAPNRSYRFCTPAIFLDGVIWGGRIDDLPVAWIEGMEVYSRASQAPAPFNMPRPCGGVVLLWTR